MGFVFLRKILTYKVHNFTVKNIILKNFQGLLEKESDLSPFEL